MPVEKTRAEIETLLKRHGATAFASASDAERSMAWIVFRLADRMFRLEVRMALAEHAPKSKAWESVSQREQRTARWAEAEDRRRWRAQLLLVKAKLEMIATGETTVEREFLADMLTPNGSTVGRQIAARLAEMYKSGNDLPLLGTGDP